MSSSSLKNELADHIYQYLCHEAQYSDLSEAARESLTAASECIEQAYKLNNNVEKQQHQSVDSTIGHRPAASNILSDELLRIFTRHKEFLAKQQRGELFSSSKQLHYSVSESSSKDEKPDIKVNSNPITSSSSSTTTPTASSTTPLTTLTNDSHNTGNNPISGNCSNQNTPNLNTVGNQASGVGGSSSSSGGPTTGQNEQQPPQSQQQQTIKQHSQHTISQLPMTTRKKLSHIRAQIKRQASKAARSRLEKRSSVSGVTPSSCGASGGSLSGIGGHHNLGSLGSSIDANNLINSRQAGDGFNSRDNTGNQANSSNDSSNAHLNNPSTSSPVIGPSAGGSGQTESSNTNSGGKSSGHHHNESSNTGGIKLSHLIPGNHHHSIGVSVHQKNFKQKLIALIKKFRTDGSDFDSEEQYREALERELMKATAGRGSRAIEELLEEEIEVEGDSGSEPEDWDNISESSTPKPSLRPFFSSTTLDKI